MAAGRRWARPPPVTVGELSFTNILCYTLLFWRAQGYLWASLSLAGLRPLALRDVCFCVTPENYFTFFLPSTAAEEEEAAPQEAAPHVDMFVVSTLFSWHPSTLNIWLS